MEITNKKKPYLIFCDNCFWLLADRERLTITKDALGTVTHINTWGQKWEILGPINNTGLDVDMSFNIVDG